MAELVQGTPLETESPSGHAGSNPAAGEQKTPAKAYLSHCTCFCYMDFFQAVVLGLIQGITEWLPISSQGQTIVAGMQLFGIGPSEAFRQAIFLHLGTAAAAAVYFRKEIRGIARPENRRLLLFILTALAGSMVTALPIYLLFRHAVQSGFMLMLLIGIALLFTGAIQLRKRAIKPREGIGSGFVTGLAQGVSVVPGISRSGITTTALLFQSFKPEQAFRLSFILSIPSVLLAEIAFGFFEGFVVSPEIIVAAAVAAVVGYASIGLLLRFAKRVNFALFCILFGLFYIGLAFF